MRSARSHVRRAVAAPDLHQCIGEAPPQGGIAYNLLQFGVQTLIAAYPVDVGVDVGKEKGHEVWKRAVENLLLLY
jgi:hypothetical protein